MGPADSKVRRAETVLPLVEAGQVLLPQGARWAEELIEEAAVFPSGAHADRVDALVMACLRVILHPVIAYTAFADTVFSPEARVGATGSGAAWPRRHSRVPCPATPLSISCWGAPSGLLRHVDGAPRRAT